MIERLAIPSWNAKPASLEDWTRTLSELGHEPRVELWDDITWIMIPHPRLKGLAVVEGAHLEAIDFELLDPDVAPALALLESAATSLGWEIHEADDEDDT